MRIGIVTVTYNSAQVIDEFMASLLQQSYVNYTVFIVDNASSDLTLHHLSQYHDPRIRVLQNSENLGVAEGNNQGIRAALESGCGSILFINNDTEFDSSLLETLVEGLKEHGCDMIAPKILFHDNRKLIWSAGGGFTASKGHAGIHYGHGEIDQGQYDVSRKVEHAPTCCLLVRSDVFAKIGLMDSRYFVYIDDADFCYRAMRASLTLFYLPSATVFHKVHSLTGGAESDFTVRYCTRNYIYFMLKNLGPRRGLYYMSKYQARLLLKLVFRRIDMARFILQQKAFVEGVQVWRHRPAQ